MAGDDDRNEIIVAAVALVVSVIAFVATFMQCLQQYFASARGYAQCNEKVIGGWATTKTRRFSFKELRFEVEFDAPVIFVCPPDNDNKPVPGTKMYQLDGTETSLRDTWTTTNLSSRDTYKERTKKERIHTADNERASWFLLLSAIQNMEWKSREWHESKYGYDKVEPPKTTSSEIDIDNKKGSLEKNRTLVVALQRKRKSWIIMPTSVTKPYATTTMCHLVEMMAVLGIYWKEFNRMNDRYRAEGNGFMVLGQRNSELGLMFNFQVNGLSRFGQNRVIPVDEVKELCFGWVPTIYRFQANKRRLEVPIDLKDLSSLQMGSKDEIAETLMMIGCNNNAVNDFLEEGTRTSHVFPVPFEILGMLSQTFHIEDTYFTFIPNPTPERWDSRSVSVVKMMASFGLYFDESSPDGQRSNSIVEMIKKHIANILDHLEGNNVETLLRFRALHAALKDTDEILTRRSKPSQEGLTASSGEDGNHEDQTQSGTSKPGLMRRVTQRIGIKRNEIEGEHSGIGMSTFNQNNPQNSQENEDASPGLSKETKEQRERRETVQDVLRIHIQEVLRVLNERGDQGNEPALAVPQQRGNARPRHRSRSPAPSHLVDDVMVSIEDVDSADPDVREDVLMKLYCKKIRDSVVKSTIAKAANRRASQQIGPAGRRESVASCDTPVSPTQLASTESPISPASKSTPTPLAVVPEVTRSTDEQLQEQGKAARITLADIDVSYDDIWCTLVFRMLCWLMLHDFNKLDVQVSKSELLGSRMPVFVA